MTLLGVPTFSTGSAATPTAVADAGVDMSLDDMIKSRRKEHRPSQRESTAASRRNTRTTNSDRTIGTSKAKREAMLNFRRGRTTTNQPTAMDIEREVYRQTRKTAKNQQKTGAHKKTGTPKKTLERPAKRAAVVKVKAKMAKERKQQAKKKQQQQTPARVGGTSHPPSKKAVKAAVTAMSEKGFSIPSGMQMVISFAPAPENSSAKKGTSKSGGKGFSKGSGRKPASGGSKGTGKGNAGKSNVSTGTRRSTRNRKK